jgi:tetratricopeptide (TPR) repeat protein
MNLGAQAVESGDLFEAEVQFSSAEIVAEKYFEGSTNHGYSLYWLGNVYGYMGRSVDAERTLQKSLAILQRVDSTDQSDLAATYEGLGLVQLDLGEIEAAKSSLDTAIDIYSKLPTSTLMDISRKINDYCSSYRIVLELESAVNCYKDAREYCVRSEGELSVCNAVILNALGEVSSDLGEIDEAVGYFDRSIEIPRERNEPYLIAVHLNNAGRKLSEASMYGRADGNLKEALSLTSSPSIYQNIPQDADPYFAKWGILINLENNEIQQENYGLAEQYANTAESIYRAKGPYDPQAYWMMKITLDVTILKQTDREDEAFKLYKSGISQLLKLDLDEEWIESFAEKMHPDLYSRSLSSP